MNVNSFDQSDHKEPDMPGHSPINKSPFSNLKGSKSHHLNITGLVKHLDELLVYIHNQSLDILTINETRLDNTIDEQNIEIAGYDILRRDRIRLGILKLKVNIHHG